MAPFDKLSNRSSDFKSVFLGTDEGERVLAAIYKLCKMNAQIHVPGDPHSTSANAGAHRVGQAIQGILAQDEQSIMSVINQNKKKEEEAGTDYHPFHQM